MRGNQICMIADMNKHHIGRKAGRYCQELHNNIEQCDYQSYSKP